MDVDRGSTVHTAHWPPPIARAPLYCSQEAQLRRPQIVYDTWYTRVPRKSSGGSSGLFPVQFLFVLDCVVLVFCTGCRMKLFCTLVHHCVDCCTASEPKYATHTDRQAVVMIKRTEWLGKKRHALLALHFAQAVHAQFLLFSGAR